ncbi:MAG: hypothetical protein WKH64_05850 [Chloroflexia bacterium]
MLATQLRSAASCDAPSNLAVGLRTVELCGCTERSPANRDIALYPPPVLDRG